MDRQTTVACSLEFLVTISRNPFALDMVRKLAECGHTVYASDTFAASPGSHPRYLAGHAVTASPRHATDAFIADVEHIVDDHGIDMVVLSFEEAFYLATRHAELSAPTTLYTGSFDQLARLHDKASFQRLAERDGVRIPRTIVAHDDASLRDAIAQFP